MFMYHIYPTIASLTPGSTVQFRYTEIDLDDAPLDRPETIRKITELFEHVQTLIASQVALLNYIWD